MANKLYQAMKVIAKAKGIKASPQNDLYKRVPPYFVNAFYIDLLNKKSGKVTVDLHYSAKYLFFDDLVLHIVEPGSTVRLTDKVRANSVIACKSIIEKEGFEFAFDGSDESYQSLAEWVFAHIEGWYRAFFDKVDAEYGNLGRFFVDNKERYPRQAALILINAEDYEAAEELLRVMQEGGNKRYVRPSSDEQRQRAVDSGLEAWGDAFLRNDDDCLIDYVAARKNSLEWTADMASFGLLSAERLG